MTDAGSRPTHPRRAFLAGAAGLGSGLLAGGRGIPTARASTPTASVMTRNLYLGVDLFRLFEAGSAEDLRRIAGRMLADVERHPYRARAGAIADEFEAHRPDVVGVQEAALVRTQRPSDFGETAAPNAEAVVVDFLALLTAEFDARDLGYHVLDSVVTNDVEIPADVDGEPVDVRLTDRVALLARDDVEVGALSSATFEATLDVPIEGASVSLDRGYCLADVTANGIDATVATTHLESVLSSVREEQARTLLDALPDDGPVVLAGDLNDGPATSGGAHDVLTRSLGDAHEALGRDAGGYTCCQAEDLRNQRSQLSRRIDAVLYRGLAPRTVEHVGEAPDDRFAVRRDEETDLLWPSDHAGVLATFGEAEPQTSTPATTTASPTATPNPTVTTTKSGTASTTPNPDGQSPADPVTRTTAPPLDGFGPLAAAMALGAVALARKLRED